MHLSFPFSVVCGILTELCNHHHHLYWGICIYREFPEFLDHGASLRKCFLLLTCLTVSLAGKFTSLVLSKTSRWQERLFAISSWVTAVFVLCCFLWKKRTGNLGTQIAFAGHFRVRVMTKVASRNSWGLANVGPERKQEYFCLDSICKPERKGLLDHVAYILAASPDEVR